MKFTGKTGWQKFFFGKVKDLETILAILLKADSTTDIFRQGFCKIAPFKNLENSLLDVYVIAFLTKLQPFSLQVVTLLKMRRLTIYKN